MCYRRVPYATYENSEEAVAERNDAYLATEALLVDDTDVFGGLTRAPQPCTVFLHDRTEKLRHHGSVP